MISNHRFAFALLLTAASTYGCGEGSGANVGGTGPGPNTTGAGGTNATSSGTTVTGAGGNSATGAGGDPATGAGGDPATGAGGNPATGAGGSGGTGMGGANPATGAGGSGGTGAGGGGAGGTGPMGGINSGAGPWGTPVPGGPTATGTMVTGTVTVNRTMPVGNVGSHFLGFSVEKTHLTNSSLTGSNARFIALYKLIGPVNLRIGANDVERCNWVPGAMPAAGVPLNNPVNNLHPIGTAMVDDLAAFLTASGANVIYGVNFQANNPMNDAQEATYAASKLGSSLYAFEIGNELDRFGNWATQQRAPFEAIAGAIRTAVPNAKFVGPAGTTGAVGGGLLTGFATNESQFLGPSLIQLTQHYYLGAAGAGSLPVMQTIKADITSTARALNMAATTNNISGGWRWGELNSFFNHGQAGLSDALVASFWALDVMFSTAQLGSVGVNFHGGENGQDGTTPFNYEPIEESGGGMVQTVRPVYYGMLMAYLAGQGRMLSTTVNAANPNFTAYSVDYTSDGSTSVVLNNKNATTGVQTTVNVGSPVASASAIYLTSTANTLNGGFDTVRLAGAQVTPAGVWQRNAPFIQSTTGNTATVFVPPASAVLVRVVLQ